VSNSDLGDFLRARRERTSPADVGLRDTGRRRTPGLRREEVATLAGVSVDYLVRLEQGRDTNPSREVVLALAQALRLTDAERSHLGILAMIGGRHDLCPSAGATADATVPSTVLALVDRLVDTPAFVVGPYNDVLVWNAPWGELVDPLGMISGEPPNLASYVFGDDRAASVYVDWEAAADEQVGTLRSAVVRWRDDVRLAALLDALRTLPEFERRWSSHTVAAKGRGTKLLRHPDHGELRLAYEVLDLPDEDGQRLITWLPADDATARVLHAERAPAPVSPARLRVVGDH